MTQWTEYQYIPRNYKKTLKRNFAIEKYNKPKENFTREVNSRHEQSEGVISEFLKTGWDYPVWGEKRNEWKNKKEATVTYKVYSIRLTAYLIFRNHGGWKAVEWYYLKCLKKKKKPCKPKILCLVKLRFKNEGEIKILLDKWKLREFITSIHVLQDMAKRVRKFSKLKWKGTRQQLEAIQKNK